MKTPKFLAAALLLFAAAALHPNALDAQSIAGRWQATMPTRVQNINGVESAVDSVIIEFTFEQRGDSVFGRSQALSGPGASRPARLLKGRISNGTITLDAEPVEALIRSDAGESKLQMTTSYVLKLDGEWLTGTQESTSTDGSVSSEPRAFRAKRAS